MTEVNSRVSRKCPRCGFTKSITLFSKDITKLSGFSSHCKSCESQSQKNRRNKGENFKRGTSPPPTPVIKSNGHREDAINLIQGMTEILVENGQLKLELGELKEKHQKLVLRHAQILSLASRFD